MKMLCAATLVVGAVLAGHAATGSQALVDRSIVMTVLDKDGVPLTDLKPTELIVMENGESREVVSAELATDPMAVALVVDTSKPTIGIDLPVRELRAGLTELVNAVYAANPASLVAYMDISGAAVKSVNFTSKADQMTKFLSRIATSQRSSGVLVEGLLDIGKDLQKVAPIRRALVAVSFEAPEATSTVQPRDAAMAVQKSGASFWAVTVGGNSSAQRDVFFENLPPATGGERITMVAGTGLEPALKRVGAALTAQYVVTYRGNPTVAATAIQSGSKRGAKVLRASLVR